MPGIRTGFTLLAAAALALGQDTRLSGPDSGYVFDETTGALRLIAGVPGAAYLGPSLMDGLVAAAVSPDGRLALVVRESEILLFRFDTGASVPLGRIKGAGGIVWSGDSGAAAVSAETIVLFNNLDGEPGAVRLPAFPEARALVVENGGAGVLVSGADGVYRLTAEGARLVAAVGDPGGLALSGGALYVVSRASREVLRIRNYRESGEVSIVLGGFEDPVAVAVSGSRLLVADKSARSLVIAVALTGEVTGRQGLDFEPSMAAPLASGLFRLNSRASADDPLQVFDPKQDDVFFIPSKDLAASGQ